MIIQSTIYIRAGKLLAFALFSLLFFNCSAQIKDIRLNSNDSCLLIVNIDSCFFGGKDEFNKYVYGIIKKHPEIKRNNDSTFMFYYEFLIDTAGRVNDVTTYRSRDINWTNEFSKRLKNSPVKWKIIRFNGKKVEYIYRTYKYLETY
jgi:hypothetical protein